MGRFLISVSEITRRQNFGCRSQVNTDDMRLSSNRISSDLKSDEDKQFKRDSEYSLNRFPESCGAGYERESGLSVAVSRGALDSIRSAMAGWG